MPISYLEIGRTKADNVGKFWTTVITNNSMDFNMFYMVIMSLLLGLNEYSMELMFLINLKVLTTDKSITYNI